MSKLPAEVFRLIQEKIEKRPNPKDSNFNYVHQEDAIDIAKLAFKLGSKCPDNKAMDLCRKLAAIPAESMFESTIRTLKREAESITGKDKYAY
jgi:hypothetical protein